jgi:pimeloyl-ACP methyl ester carboxylesterase
VRTQPVHLSYETGGHSEHCLSFGTIDATRTILIVPPLFDEMNRTRRMLVEAMRALGAQGVRTLLPDLPGCNESLACMSEQTLLNWRNAVTNCASQLSATHIASIRGGCLIDDATNLPVWRLAPAKGASLLKTMLRTRIAADKEAGISTTVEQLLIAAKSAPLDLAGLLLGREILAELDLALPTATTRIHEVALADINGTPLWLRAEPDEDSAMSAAIAADLDRWSASCAG